METTEEIVDLEARYHDLLGDARRPLGRFVEVSLAYGRHLAGIDLPRAHQVLITAIQALHDPPAPGEVDLAIQLLSADESVARRLGDVEAQITALRRLRAAVAVSGSNGVTGASAAAIDLRRRSSRALAADRRASEALAELCGAIEDAHGESAVSSFALLVTDLVVMVASTPFEVADLIEAEGTLRRVRAEHRAGDDDRPAQGWVAWSLIGLAALRLALGDPESAEIYVDRLRKDANDDQLPAAAGVVMAQLALVEDDLEAAVSISHRLITPTTTDRRLSRIVHSIAGQALAGRGQVASAIELLEGVDGPAGRSPDRIDVAVRTTLADLYAAAGEHARAYLALRGVVGTSPSEPAESVTVDLRDLRAPAPAAGPSIAETIAAADAPHVDPSWERRIEQLEAVIADRTRAFDSALDRVRELEALVVKDPLTGLLGREALRAALAERLASTHPVAVLSVDLDRFGRVNESFGHGAGDALLVEVAERLTAVLGPDDVVARWGGDEFLVVVAGLGERTAATSFADALRSAVSVPWTATGVAAVPVEMAGRVVPTISVGVTVGRDGEVSVDELVRQADAAASAAKAAGGDRVELFGGSLGGQARRRLEAEALVRAAIEHHWFELHYQPIFSNATGRPEGAEALLRIRHPERGLIAPLEFLAAVEEARLGSVVGAWVLDVACTTAAGWSARHPGFRMAVNIAPALLSDDLPEIVSATARRRSLDPAALVLELTEHTILDADDRQVAVLAALREHGVRIALDDFGTAYSSLRHLRRFPVDVVKIDRTFVAGIVHHPHDAAIVRAIVGLSHEFGFRVIAEGVETEEQFDVQHRLGCFGAQGYFLGRPVPADELEAVLASNAAPASAG